MRTQLHHSLQHCRTKIGHLLTVAMLAFVVAGISNRSIAQTNIPLLLGESRTEKGALLPVRPAFLHIFHHVEHELHAHFELRNYPWNRAVLNAGNGEGLIFGLSITSERSKIFHFSEPVYYNYLWLVTRSDATFPFATLNDLKGKKIGIIRGSNYGDEFDQQKNKLFTVEDDVNAYPPRLKKLLSKRMDAMVFPSPEANPLAVEAQVNRIMLEEVSEMKFPPGITFKILPVPVLKDGVRFAIKAENDNGLIDKINQAIATGHASGKLPKTLDSKQK